MKYNKDKAIEQGISMLKDIKEIDSKYLLFTDLHLSDLDNYDMLVNLIEALKEELTKRIKKLKLTSNANSIQ